MYNVPLDRIIEMQPAPIKTLDFMKGFFIDFDRIPMPSEISKSLGIKKSHAENHISKLVEKQIIVPTGGGFYRWSRRRYQVIPAIK